jgi:hypothetical protein
LSGAVKVLALLIAAAGSLAPAACADTDTGGSTTVQIDQDIRAEDWLRNQQPPTVPGPQPAETGTASEPIRP